MIRAIESAPESDWIWTLASMKLQFSLGPTLDVLAHLSRCGCREQRQQRKRDQDQQQISSAHAGPPRFVSSQADLLVQNTEHQIARQMQFGKDWNWIKFPGADKPIPARYALRANLALTYMEIMKE